MANCTLVVVCSEYEFYEGALLETGNVLACIGFVLWWQVIIFRAI